MNPDIAKEVDNIKRANFVDGLGKQDNTKSIITIQYWRAYTASIQAYFN